MRLLVTTLFTLYSCVLVGQNWIDSLYAIESEIDVVYGTATDFAGATDTLRLDISAPLDDSVRACGRPLMVIVHGGGWVDGSKSEGYIPRLREEFAERGYVTAAVNYRLGMFYTHLFRNCNVPGWNCLNMTDSSEWYRANYRAMQDVRGAIRYLVNHTDDYQIDPNNVFVVGESAGAFIAMSVGLMDDPSEVDSAMVTAYPDAPPPNDLYDACIAEYGLYDGNDNIDYSRPALGDYQGILNLPTTEPYTIRGVGAFYGAVFDDILRSYSDVTPVLYMYHQPCDLIVPMNKARIFAGFVDCLLGLGCGYPINRPIVCGSKAITGLIDDWAAAGVPTSEYQFDQSTDNFNCFQQLNAGQACHTIDNFPLRTGSMAALFASRIDFCISNTNELVADEVVGKLYPNPATERVTIELVDHATELSLELVDLRGRVMRRLHVVHTERVNLSVADLPKGLYLLRLQAGGRTQVSKLLVAH